MKNVTTRDKNNFWSEHVFWKQISPHLFIYPFKNDQDCLQKKVFEINCWEKINSKLNSVKRINSDKKQKIGGKMENYDMQEKLNFLLKKVEW